MGKFGSLSLSQQRKASCDRVALPSLNYPTVYFCDMLSAFLYRLYRPVKLGSFIQIQIQEIVLSRRKFMCGA